MKGGITSGVVYPFALCELARTYRFANVGGTSAGAIAAAARRRGRARPRARRLREARRAPRVDRRRRQPLPPVPAPAADAAVLPAPHRRARPEGRREVGARRRCGAPQLPACGPRRARPRARARRARARTGSGALAVCAFVAGIVLALLGLAVALGLRLAVGLPRALGRNRFGLCSGLVAGGKRGPRADAVARRPDRRPRGEGGRRPAHVRRPAREGHRPPDDDDERHPSPPATAAVAEPRAPLRPGRAAAPLPGADRRVDGGAPSPIGNRSRGASGRGGGSRRSPRSAPSPRPTTCPSSSRRA